MNTFLVIRCYFPDPNATLPQLWNWGSFHTNRNEPLLNASPAPNPSACREFFVSRNKVGVQMSFEYVADFKILLVGRFQINVHIALRIHHCGFALRSDHVRSMSQTREIRLFKIQIVTPDGMQLSRDFQIVALQIITVARRGRYCSPIRNYRSVWSAEVFARSPRNWEKSLLRMFSNLLTGLWLNDAPSAYSFCNLDLHPITAYSQ